MVSVRRRAETVKRSDIADSVPMWLQIVLVMIAVSMLMWSCATPSTPVFTGVDEWNTFEPRAGVECAYILYIRNGVAIDCYEVKE